MSNRYTTKAEIEGAKRRQDGFEARMEKKGIKRINIWMPEPLLEPLRRFGEAARLGAVDLQTAADVLDGLANSEDLEALKMRWVDKSKTKLKQAKAEGRIGAPGIGAEKIAAIKRLRAKGVPALKVAEELGISAGSVYKHCPAVK